MRCAICKQGNAAPSTVTVTLDREGTVIIFRNVPAEVCQTCGEQYVDEKTTRELLKQATLAAKSGVQVEVRAYAAA
ncbi:MAG TPA: type II toxin-antitoxin system MqsA family antitoxin [Phycisphaerae bacterium]|jgi:YgiT-type zinc finger domain-containing protein|nr:type II toxin-antitoxin system MqsA family antitoxin [Phycisphaerae bacterium]